MKFISKLCIALFACSIAGPSSAITVSLEQFAPGDPNIGASPFPYDRTATFENMSGTNVPFYTEDSITVVRNQSEILDTSPTLDCGGADQASVLCAGGTPFSGKYHESGNSFRGPIDPTKPVNLAIKSAFGFFQALEFKIGPLLQPSFVIDPLVALQVEFLREDTSIGGTTFNLNSVDFSLPFLLRASSDTAFDQFNFSLTYTSLAGDFQFQQIDDVRALSVIPLPASGVLLLGALGAFGLVRRRRKPA